METERKEMSASIGILILRLGTGGYLITHGWGKLEMLLAGGAEKFGDPIGLGSTLSLALVTTSEFLCAMLIILGLATRLAAVPVVITMTVAAFVIHARDPWTMEAAANAFFSGASKTWFSKEPALLYLIPFLSLVFTGGGKLSLDRLLSIHWNRRHAMDQRRFERAEKSRAA
ncbi:MAG: DoxX family protein [Deltaproteobacteria bacterium]|nr:MAG: DoxX family protein [Deltaproteobacteria bacterium]